MLFGAACQAALATPSYGQYRYPSPREYYQPAPCQPAPSQPMPYQPMPTQPGQAQPQQPPAEQQPQQPSLPGEQSAAAGGEAFAFSNGGYIDSAIPQTRFRLRFDAAYNDNRPDRAEFFYAKCGCFPDGKGPPRPETGIDYQELMAYGEVALSKRISAFLEVPYRFLNPDRNANANGFGDLNAGAKVALLADPDYYFSFQLRAFAPTGDSQRGLGTDHASIEPGLLYWQRLSDRLTVEAELRDWIPSGVSNFSGNILRYGVGFSYAAYQSCTLTVSPVVEFVGWSVLSGKEFSSIQNQTFDASGDTIFNAKLGVRVRFRDHNDFYVGYGRALTGEVWYKDILRAEYRWTY